ncbi:hypothetical protein JL721_5948 [Aureococcus anophagefferens]|nr:hypothetical protein JL721_5948 [Aureococcus anophagefferens]
MGNIFLAQHAREQPPIPAAMARPCCALLLVLAGGAFGAWEPEIEAKGRSWNALIEQELDRSWATPTASCSSSATGSSSTGGCCSKKGMHHIEFLKSVMERAPLDNVAYQWEWNADGFNSEDQLVREGCPTPANMRLNRVKPKSKLRQKDATPLPRLVIAKRYGYDQCGILVPNCYFDDLTWGRLAATITDVAAGLPFEKRDGRVFWRGSIRTEPDCDDEAGNFARTEAVALTAAHPDVFDVKCLECDVRDEARQFRPARDERATRPPSKAPISAGFLSFRLMFGRAIIPRNGLDAWMGVIAMWDAPYVEWYYPALAEGVTHLALNRSTALDAVRDVPRRAVETMLRNARAVYDRLLCPDCLAAYMRTLVRKMRAYFRLGDVLDDPDRLRRAKLNDAKPWRQRRRGDKGGTFTLDGGGGRRRPVSRAAAAGRGLAESD